MKNEPNNIKNLYNEEKNGGLEHTSTEKNTAAVPTKFFELLLANTTQSITNDHKETNSENKLPTTMKEGYQQFFDNYTVAITFADSQERITYWNPYTEELFNMNYKDLYLRPVHLLYPFEEWKRIRAENIRQKGLKNRMETQMMKKNGDLFDVEISICVLRSDEGKTAGSLAIIKDISRLKQTERKLKESEERYRTIFDNSAIGITLSDDQERIVAWNKYAENLLGMTNSELYQKPVKTLYPPEEWQKIRKENVRKKGMQHHIETKILRENNEPLDVAISLSVLKNYEGNIIGSIGIIKDISEQKRIAEALKASEQRFKLLYEKAPLPYHTLSPAGIITDVNDSWCHSMGYTREEVIGKLIFDFITPSEQATASTNFMKKMSDKKPYTSGNERRYITKSGGERVFVIHDFFSFDDHNNVQSVNTIMQDVTDRVYAETELRKSEEKYRALIQSLNEGIVCLNKDAQITFVNPRMGEILGYSYRELINKPIYDFLDPEALSQYRQYFHIDELGRNKQCEVCFKKKDDSKVWSLLETSAVFDEKGNFFEAVAGIMDITKLKQLEEDLRKKIDELNRYKEVTIDREMKMIELKKKITELESKKATLP